VAVYQVLTNSISNPTYVDVGSVNVYVYVCMYLIRMVRLVAPLL
jgi:hypothetical protein